MRSLRKNGLSLVCGSVIAAFFIAFSIINFFGFEQFCTADMYSDTYVSALMWNEKTVFPREWVFGNQFYVVVTPVLAALVYGLCGSINLAMALATTIMTVLILLSFWWMVKPFASREQILAGMAVLTGCVIGPNIVGTIEGQIFYLMASYYAGYLIALFLVFGDYVRGLVGKKSGWLPMLLALVMCFCTGMQSLRQTAVMILPICVFEGIRLLAVLLRRDGRRNWDFRPTLRAGLYGIANVLGCAAIRILDPKAITLYGELGFRHPSEWGECLSTGGRALRSVTGLKYLFSDTPLLGIVAVVLVTTAAAALIIAAMSRKKDGAQLLVLLMACSVLCVIGVSTLINIYLRSIYLFSWYAAAAVAAVVLVRRCNGWRKGAVCAVLTAALLLNLFGSYGPSVQEALEDPDSDQRQVARYLVDEGYTRLYGEWMSVASIAVWTDGHVAAGSWFSDVCSILPYINPQDIYTQEDNAQGAYLVLSWEETDFLNRAEAVGASVELMTRFDGTPYAIYTSDRQLMFHPEG